MLQDAIAQRGHEPQAVGGIEVAAAEARRCADDEVAEIKDAQVGARGRHGLPGRQPETAFVRLEALDEVEDHRLRVGQRRQDPEGVAGRDRTLAQNARVHPAVERMLEDRDAPGLPVAEAASDRIAGVVGRGDLELHAG